MVIHSVSLLDGSIPKQSQILPLLLFFSLTTENIISIIWKLSIKYFLFFCDLQIFTNFKAWIKILSGVLIFLEVFNDLQCFHLVVDSFRINTYRTEYFKNHLGSGVTFKIDLEQISIDLQQDWDRYGRNWKRFGGKLKNIRRDIWNWFGGSKCKIQDWFGITSKLVKFM